MKLISRFVFSALMALAISTPVIASEINIVGRNWEVTSTFEEAPREFLGSIAGPTGSRVNSIEYRATGELILPKFDDFGGSRTLQSVNLTGSMILTAYARTGIPLGPFETPPYEAKISSSFTIEDFNQITITASNTSNTGASVGVVSELAERTYESDRSVQKWLSQDQAYEYSYTFRASLEKRQSFNFTDVALLDVGEYFGLGLTNIHAEYIYSVPDTFADLDGNGTTNHVDFTILWDQIRLGSSEVPTSFGAQSAITGEATSNNLDLNQDGLIDTLDLLAFEGHSAFYSTLTPDQEKEVDGVINGIIDTINPNRSLDFEYTNVPEPSSFLLAVLGFVGVLTKRR